jgi:hypothetical protein
MRGSTAKSGPHLLSSPAGGGGGVIVALCAKTSFHWSGSPHLVSSPAAQGRRSDRRAARDNVILLERGS